MSRVEVERLLRESYAELCKVTKQANDIERQAGELRARAAELSLRIHIVLGGLEESTETRESRVSRPDPPFSPANPATHDHGRKL